MLFIAVNKDNAEYVGVRLLGQHTSPRPALSGNTFLAPACRATMLHRTVAGLPVWRQKYSM